MLSYTEKEVPVITALAREFAICDNWFSSMPGPTFPNRCFFHAASSAGLDDTPTKLDEDLFKAVSGLIFENGTIYDMLDSENIDWAVYHGNFFPQVFELAGMDPATRLSNFHSMDDWEQDLQEGSVANYVFIEPNYGDKGSDIPHCGNSQHPLEDVTFGEGLIKRVYEAIRNSPLWGQSMLIVTYDEGGGFSTMPSRAQWFLRGTTPPAHPTTKMVSTSRNSACAFPQSSAHRGSRAMSSITDRTSTPPYLRR
jgi:phospholipase C